MVNILARNTLDIILIINSVQVVNILLFISVEGGGLYYIISR